MWNSRKLKTRQRETEYIHIYKLQFEKRPESEKQNKNATTWAEKTRADEEEGNSHIMTPIRQQQREWGRRWQSCFCTIPHQKALKLYLPLQHMSHWKSSNLPSEILHIKVLNSRGQ